MNSILESLLVNDESYKWLDNILDYNYEINDNEIATEGFFTDFIKNIFAFNKLDKNFKPDNLSEYSEIIDQNANGEIFSKNPHAAFQYFTVKPVVIDNKRQIITIRKMN